MKSKCKKCKHCSFYQIKKCPPYGDVEVDIVCTKYHEDFDCLIKKCVGYERRKRFFLL